MLAPFISILLSATWPELHNNPEAIAKRKDCYLNNSQKMSGFAKCSQGRPLCRLRDMDMELIDTSQPELDEFTLLSSPLSSISPNLLNFSPGRKVPKASSVTSTLDAGPNRHGTQAEEADSLAPLHRFGRRKVDPRRQSTAIFSAFAESMSTDGLLGDEELAVGDDDILIPLAKASNALAAKGNSTLWVDPDTDELLETNLPELELDSLRSPTLTGKPSTKAVPGVRPRSDGAAIIPAGNQDSSSASQSRIGVRDSVALLAGFVHACEGPGLDAVNEEDELAVLPRPPSARDPPPEARDEQGSVGPSSKGAPAALRPSRLRPPSSSSAFFSNAAASSR